MSDMYDSKLSGAMDPSGKYVISTVLKHRESALSDRRRQRVIECDSVRLDKRECVQQCDCACAFSAQWLSPLASSVFLWFVHCCEYCSFFFFIFARFGAQMIIITGVCLKGGGDSVGRLLCAALANCSHCSAASLLAAIIASLRTSCSSLSFCVAKSTCKIRHIGRRAYCI